MLPDMSDVLSEWSQPVKLKTVTTTTVNFEPVQSVDVQNIVAVVQVADMEKLNPDMIDWSRRYLMIHAKVPLDVGQVIEYKGADYKIIAVNNYGDYGFYDVTAEETKLPLVVQPEPPEEDDE